MKKKKEIGSFLMVVVCIAVIVLLCTGKQALIYNEEETLTLTSCGSYDDGIFEYDTLEFYAISAMYESEYLSIPSTCYGFTVDSLNSRAFLGTPVRYVLLPETIRTIHYPAPGEITLFTDNEELAQQGREQGFEIMDTAQYHKMVAEAQRPPFSLKNAAKNFEALAGTPWIIAVVLGLYYLIRLCAKIREKAGYDNPLSVLTDYGNPLNIFFVLVQIVAAVIVFYVMLFETEEIGIASEDLMAAILNWPLKLAIGAFVLVLIVDLFFQNTIPWYLGRVVFRCVRVLMALGIGAALGAFLGSVSLQFRFIVHLIAAAPIPVALLLGGIMATVLLNCFLGLFAPRKKPKGESQNPNGDLFDLFGDDDSPMPRKATTTLIGPDNVSYPVQHVGYGYMVNGKMLIDFDPYGDNRPVDESGKEYIRY